MMGKRFNNPNIRYPVNARSHKATLTSGSQDKGLSYRQTPVGRLCTLQSAGSLVGSFRLTIISYSNTQV